MTKESGEDQRKDGNKWKLPCIGIVLLLCIIILILALTEFKIKDPRIQVLFMAVDGIAPHALLQIQLNITLDLKIQVENPNSFSFKYETGKSVLKYKDNQVGEMDIHPGFVSAHDSTIIPCKLALTLDALSSNTTQLLDDVQAGNLMLDCDTEIPGRVAFFGGLIKKHIVATSKCETTIGFPNIEILRQQCNTWGKF